MATFVTVNYFLKAMNKQFEATNDEKYKCPHDAAIYAIDALGFRRGPDAVTTLLKDSGIESLQMHHCNIVLLLMIMTCHCFRFGGA